MLHSFSTFDYFSKCIYCTDYFQISIIRWKKKMLKFQGKSHNTGIRRSAKPTRTILKIMQTSIRMTLTLNQLKHCLVVRMCYDYNYWAYFIDHNYNRYCVYTIRFFPFVIRLYFFYSYYIFYG